MTRMLSWLAIFAALTLSPGLAQAGDSLVFGTPQRPTLYGSTGYSGILRGGFVQPSSPTMSLGGELILDLGGFGSLDAAGNLTTLAGAFRLDLTLMENEDLLVGFTFTPGIGVAFPRFGDAAFALLLHPDLNIGYKVSPQVVVGGGITVPFTLYVGQGGAAVAVPVLFGPVAEFRLTPDLGIFTQLKLGPTIFGGSGGGVGGSRVDFGMDLRAGVSYSF